MCGIAGFYGFPNAQVTSVESMLRLMRHRGPDESVVFRHHSYVAGMTRLSINGGVNGKQPLTNEDESLAVLYNGEIYNYAELKKSLIKAGHVFRSSSDGEVICHLFEEHGIGSFDLLDGMFAIALYDRKTSTLYLCRDSVGEKPLYFSVNKNKGVAFSSETRALRRSPLISTSLNLQALWDFPTFLWIPEPQTSVCEINAVEPGTVMIISKGVIHTEKYSHEPNHFLPFENDSEAVEEVRSAIRKSVKSRLLSDQPVGSFLSGGLDSSIITTLMREMIGEFDTFTIGFGREHDPIHGASDESRKARYLSRLLGLRHHIVSSSAITMEADLTSFIEFADEPFAVSSGLGILAISRTAAQFGTKVLLSGDCADEIFGGYSWYSKIFHNGGSPNQDRTSDNLDGDYSSLKDLNRDPMRLLADISKYNYELQNWSWHYYASERDKGCLFHEDIVESSKTSLRHLVRNSPESFSHPRSFIEHDRRFYMRNEMLRKLDRMTMAFSVEGRVPFASKEVQSLSMRLRDDQLIRFGTTKWLLRQAFRDELPRRVLTRPKHGFNVPIDAWLRGPWRHLVDETFAPSSSLNSYGLLSKSAMRNAQNMLDASNRLNGHTIFAYITLNRWLEREQP